VLLPETITGENGRVVINEARIGLNVVLLKKEMKPGHSNGGTALTVKMGLL